MYRVKKGTFNWIIGAVLLLPIVNWALVPIGTGWFLLGILLALGVSSAYIIPTIHFGLQTTLGRRVGLLPGSDPRAVREGIQFTWPLISTFELFKIEVGTTEVIPFTSTSHDKLDIEVEGSIQWLPDKKRLNRFIAVGEETIKRGLIDAVKGRIGELAGQSNGNDFYQNRAAISFLINCHLRLPAEEKHELETILDGECQKPAEDGEDGEETVFDLKKLMDRDEDIKRFIAIMKDKKRPSEIEKFHGIKISAFRLADVNFTKETRKALELQRQREYQMEGATMLSNWKRDDAQKWQGLGLGPKDASDTADLTVEQAITEPGQEPRITKRVFSVGDVGAVAEFIRSLRASETPSQPQRKEE